MIRKMMTTVLILVLLAACGGPPAEESGRGLLMIVGGKDKPEAALSAFIEHCDGGLILVIPSASAVPLESGPEAAELFRQHGAQHAEWLFIEDKEMADSDSTAAKVQQAAGIFFTGGVQTRLMGRIGGTAVEEAVKRLYFEKGGAVGGTSAGAAVMSEIMITGDGDFSVIEKDNVDTEAGLGLLTNCIIDQHFVKRSRHNRLLSLSLEHSLPGIGIDESTAVLYHPDDTFQVTGEGQVLVYDPRTADETGVSGQGKLSAEGLSLTVLHAGQRFDMNKGKVLEKDRSPQRNIE